MADEWQRKGRPRVVGFRYDLETQLDLVRLHAHDFKFYSRAASAAAILGVIDTARADARALRVRTFCQPDTVVAKQLLDAQGLFNILGCPDDQQIKLAEIVAFFKAAIERRRVQELQMVKLQQERMEQMQGGGGVGGGGGDGHHGAGMAAAALTSPARNSRSPTARQGDDRWGTAPAAGMAGQLRGSNSSAAAGKMDLAGYDSRGE